MLITDKQNQSLILQTSFVKDIGVSVCIDTELFETIKYRFCAVLFCSVSGHHSCCEVMFQVLSV